MKLESTRGFHSVEGPNGNEIVVEEPFEVDETVGVYLLENYSGMRVVEPDTTDETRGDEPSEPTCGVNGCSRGVDSPDETCWQH